MNAKVAMVRTLMEIPSPKGGAPWRWIDVCQPTAEELAVLVKEHELHETSVADCLDPGHLPKYEIVEDYTFLIVRFNSPPRAGQEGVYTVQSLTNKIAMFLGPETLITVHRHGERLVNEVYAAWMQRGPSRRTPDLNSMDSDLLAFRLTVDLLKTAVHSYEGAVRDAQSEVEEFEDRIFNEKDGEAHAQEFLANLYALKRRAKVFSRMLHLSKNLLIRLEGPISAAPEDKAPFLQDLAESADRLLLLADEVIDTANLLLNYYLSLSSHRTNEVVRVLTVFSAFFMPLTFIVGLYGMNFHNMPELSWTWGYPSVLVLMAVVSIAIWIYFKRKRIT